jgi:hypothetical protein
MLDKPVVLARYEDFGSVSRCLHGCVHIQLGHTVMVLTEEQYLRYVAMVTESAANFEFFRYQHGSAPDEDESGSPPAPPFS